MTEIGEYHGVHITEDDKGVWHGRDNIKIPIKTQVVFVALFIGGLLLIRACV